MYKTLYLLIILLALHCLTGLSYAATLPKLYTGEFTNTRAKFTTIEPVSGEPETISMNSRSKQRGKNNTTFELHPDDYVPQGVVDPDIGSNQIYAHLDGGDVLIGTRRLLFGTKIIMGNVHIFLKFFTGDSDYDPITDEYSGTGKVYYFHGSGMMKIKSNKDGTRAIMRLTGITAHTVVIYSIQDGVIIDETDSLVTSIDIKPVLLDSVPLQ